MSHIVACACSPLCHHLYTIFHVVTWVCSFVSKHTQASFHVFAPHSLLPLFVLHLIRYYASSAVIRWLLLEYPCQVPPPTLPFHLYQSIYWLPSKMTDCHTNTLWQQRLLYRRVTKRQTKRCQFRPIWAGPEDLSLSSHFALLLFPSFLRSFSFALWLIKLVWHRVRLNKYSIFVGIHIQVLMKVWRWWLAVFSHGKKELFCRQAFDKCLEI